MHIDIKSDWKSVLKDEFEKPYFIELMNFVRKEYEENTCFPPIHQVFEAFNHFSFYDTKVIIIGQDPYHGKGQSHGLCFSVRESVPIPPSLRNIFLEIHRDTGAAVPESGDLTRWANQGVLLLNAIMTVREKQAGSHQNKGWEKFTDTVIKKLSEEREDLVFLVWGGPAKKKARLIDKNKHLILSSGHPSPLAANRGYWFGNKHFSQTNDFLKNIGKTPIQW